MHLERVGRRVVWQLLIVAVVSFLLWISGAVDTTSVYVGGDLLR